MLVKRPVPLAEPRSSCRNCQHRDPQLKVCCARDTIIMENEIDTYCCGDWEPKKTTDLSQVIAQPESKSVKISLQKGEENQQVFGGTSLQELEAKAKVWGHQQEAKTLDRGAKQGMTLEALDTVFAIACQQVPSMEKRWMELKAEINVMFAQKWAAEDMPK